MNVIKSEFTAVLNKEFKHVRRWKRSSCSVKLIRFIISHYNKVPPSFVKLDGRINVLLTKPGYKNIRSKVKLILQKTEQPGNFSMINAKLDQKYLTWEQKKLVK
jgi:ribosomal protein L31E